VGNLNVNTVEKYKPDNLKVIIDLLKYPDFIVNTTGHKHLHLIFGGKQRQNLSVVFRKIFHLCAIQHIMDRNIALQVANDDTSFQAV
jgi:hypothetical protein